AAIARGARAAVRSCAMQPEFNPLGSGIMRSTFVKVGVAALALLATPFAAAAADMPVRGYYKSAPRSVVAYYNWTGFYVGGVLGYGFGSSNWSPDGASPSPKGLTYGVTAGYNWQSGSMVYGAEFDYSFSSVKGSAACGVALAFSCETSNTWLGTARGRLGYSFDRFLPYITGGAAFGNIKATASSAAGTATDSATKVGYALGAGLEYAFLGNWTAKLEYLYVDLGSFSSTPLVNSVSFKESLIRLGV